MSVFYHGWGPNFKKSGLFMKKWRLFIKKSGRSWQKWAHSLKKCGHVWQEFGHLHQKPLCFFLISSLLCCNLSNPHSFSDSFDRLYIHFPRFCLETKGGAQNSSPFDADQSFMRQVFLRMGDRTTPKSDGTSSKTKPRTFSIVRLCRDGARCLLRWIFPGGKSTSH